MFTRNTIISRNISRSVRAFGAVSFLSLALATSASAAEQKTVQRTVTVYSLSDNPKLAEAVKAICGDAAVKLSDKARKACDDNVFPPLTKALNFRNSGIGAEFNAMARQRNG